MATRKGATTTVGGKRYRYNGTKWVQVKATGNVTPTSSRNRSARSRSSSANVTNDNNRPRRGGNRTTTDTQRTSTGSARVTTKPLALPPGTKGGALASTKPGRRRNVNSNAPSSGTRTAGGGLPPRLRGVLENRGILPPASTPKGTSKPTDGRNQKPTRRQTATAKARQAAQGSSTPGVRAGTSSNPSRLKGKIGGPAASLIERGLSSLLAPIAGTVGYEGAKAIRGALGGGAPKLDKNGKPIKKPVAKGPGLRDVNGKPLPANNKQFKDLISSKVPGASAGASKPPKAKDTPKPTPTRSTGSSGGRSGASSTKPKPVPRKPQSKDMSANMKAWAKANPTLAAKVKKGQSGYDAIQSVVKGSKTKPTKPTAKSTGSKAKPTKRPLTAPIKNIEDTNFFKKERDKKKKNRRLSGMPLNSIRSGLG